VTREDVERAKEFLRQGKATVNLLADRRGLLIRAVVKGQDAEGRGHEAQAVIEGQHDRIVSLSLDGEEVPASPLLAEAVAGGGKSQMDELEDWLRGLSLADLLALVKDLPWRQPTCPVCGGAPNMSVLRKSGEDDAFLKSHGGRRFLRCSCCSSEWTYKRVSCPSCGCEEPDDLFVLRDPSRPSERADSCKRCKAFVLCLDSGELVDVPDADVAALTMLPLEIQACKQGFVPMALHPWSML